MGFSIRSSAPVSNRPVSNSRPFASGKVSRLAFSASIQSRQLSLTLDVFGGERRTVESLGAQRDVQYYNALGTYLTLSGNWSTHRGRSGLSGRDRRNQPHHRISPRTSEYHCCTSTVWRHAICKYAQHSKLACDRRSDASTSSAAACAYASSPDRVGGPGTWRRLGPTTRYLFRADTSHGTARRFAL